MKTQLLISLWVLVLAGCASTQPAPVTERPAPTRIESDLAAKTAKAAPTEKLYTVKKGDTLYSIALDHGIEYRELAAWNNIENPSRIKVGQTLRVAPPAGAPEAAAPVGGTEVRPIVTSGPVTARSLDGTPAAVSPAPTYADSATHKRTPKGGKLPYTEENLARLKADEAAPQPVVMASVAQTVAPTEKPTEKPAEKQVPTTAMVGEIEWGWPAQGKLIGTFSEGGNGAEASKGIDIAGKLGEPVQAAAAGKVVYVGSGLRGYGNLVIVRHNADYLSAYAHNSRILVKEGQAVSRGQKIAELGNSDADQPKLHFEVRHQGKPTDPLKFLPTR